MKSISTSLRRASAAVALGLAAAAAHATPVVWQLDNVKFTDGASATGSFTFDADTLSYSAWSIQTTNGMFAGQTYDTSTSSTYSALNSAHHFFINLLNNSRYLTFDLVGDLTNAGGSVAIRTPAGNGPRDGSFECLNCAPYRMIASGSMVAQAVPEPGSLALVGGSLGLLGWVGRRNRNRS